MIAFRDAGTAFAPGVQQNLNQDAQLERRSVVDLEVVIPAYNEAARLPATLERTIDFLKGQSWSSRVVVVDNGSADDTGYIVQGVSAARPEVPVSLVGCASRGKGAAVRRGMLSGTSTFTGFFDADLATPLETLTAAMEHLQRGAGAVIASRHAPGATFVRRQGIGRRLGGTAFRAMTGSMVLGVRDTQCGFKFFERAALVHAMVRCRTSGFAFDVELLQHLQQDGGQIVEVPVAWTDGPESSFRPVRDGIASFAALYQMQGATA